MSDRAIKDVNYIPSKLAVLNTDTKQGKHLVAIAINGTTGAIETTTTDTISFTMQPMAPKDVNGMNCWTFEGTDGNTYPAVATAQGHLLIST